MSAIPLRKTVHYPDSDGQPMADNDAQYRVMTDLKHALETHYGAEPAVYVAADLLVYYVEGNPGARLAPDVFVAFGVGKGDRSSYLVWEEGSLPSIVFEIASQTGWRKLLGSKKDRYQEIGIPEYIVFDPDGELIRPRFQGFRLQNGRYWPIPLEADGSLLSRTTGLKFEPEGNNLRVVDPVTGRRYLWAKESEAARQTAEERAQAAEEAKAQEAAARQAAEEAAAREAAARRIAEERAQAAEETAAREAAARRALEEELAQLRAGLDRRGPDGDPRG